MAGKLKPGAPVILKRSKQRMAVIRVQGDPNVVAPKNLPALYNTVYSLRKTAGKFKVEKLRARWPGIESLPKEKWIGLYALPIPNDTKSLPPQDKVPGLEVKIEGWEYGDVAEILHVGPYTKERPSIQKLREFITKNGYQIIGDHEEEYISDPRRTTPEKLQTILRVRIKYA